ncbi:MAG: UDP-N-acetylmuramate dehydrogenase [Prevotellaceae bacterium]|jgi:UDP-N-acetylmuramate dehydrogenase|nr:UDP-N-acetylmuramate dehydrogenase [Prevotellaceae bacterium]
MQIHRNYPLRAHNTFGFDVKALYYAAPSCLEALGELLAHPSYNAVPRLVMGGGSNLLFRKDFPGLVIHLQLRECAKIAEDETTVTLRAGAGVVWDDFVAHCVAHRWGGVENLSGIPGTVGASPVQNIGAYGVEVETAIKQVEALRIDDGQPVVFTHEACRFGYRDSVFKQAWKNKAVITHVVFELSKSPALVTHYGSMGEALEAFPGAGIEQVRQVILHTRRQKLPDPADLGNAGSFFKNPTLPKAQADELRAAYPQLPTYPVDDQLTKIPAAWLIEQCGWKGKRAGQVGVHTTQALVLVNYGGGTGNDVLQLAHAIQQSVRDKFNIQLDTEINIV